MNPEHICERCYDSTETTEIACAKPLLWVPQAQSFWLCLSCLRAFSIEVADRLEAAEKVNDEEERKAERSHINCNVAGCWICQP